MTVPADFHSADFTCSCVDVLEQVTVNGAKMIEIEIAIWDALSHSLHDELTLPIVELCGVGDGKLVP